MGDERLHELLAVQCALFASANRKKGDAPTVPEDFMPWRQRARRTDQPTWQEDMKVFFRRKTKKKGQA